MRTRQAIISDIKVRGDKIEKALKVRMSVLGLKDRALANRRTLVHDTKVFVDFVEGFDISDDNAEMKEILKKVTISYPRHGLFFERGDAPKTRNGKAIKQGDRQKKPLFGYVLPLQYEQLRSNIAELYGEEIANKMKINIPGIWSSQKTTTTTI